MLELETSPETARLYLTVSGSPRNLKIMCPGPHRGPVHSGPLGPRKLGLEWQVLAAAMLPACFPHRWAEQGWKAE